MRIMNNTDSRRESKEEALTLKTQKASSHGWNAAPSRCDAAARVTTLSNSSSHAAPASSRVRLRLTAARRSEPSAEALGPFHLTSAATAALGCAAPGASRSGEAAVAGEGEGEGEGEGGGSPSARRTNSRTRNLRAAGGRGHRIILATISGAPVTAQRSAEPGVLGDKYRRLRRQEADKGTRFRGQISGGSLGRRRPEAERSEEEEARPAGPRGGSGIGFEAGSSG
jgi:hypothetical protein